MCESCDRYFTLLLVLTNFTSGKVLDLIVLIQYLEPKRSHYPLEFNRFNSVPTKVRTVHVAVLLSDGYKSSLVFIIPCIQLWDSLPNGSFSLSAKTKF